MNDAFKDIEKLEADLWEAADNLRANSKLTSSDYFMPVLGVIFLRHAANRFEAATRQIEEDQATGKMPKRKVQPADLQTKFPGTGPFSVSNLCRMKDFFEAYACSRKLAPLVREIGETTTSSFSSAQGMHSNVRF